MLFNSRWVIEIMLGRDVAWHTQRREGGGGADWGGILLAHASHTCIGIIWALAAWHINPAFFWWISPITFGLIACAAVPLLAFIAGPIRGIPLYWRLIDSAFGLFGCIPLLLVRRRTRQLQQIAQLL